MRPCIVKWEDADRDKWDSFVRSNSMGYAFHLYDVIRLHHWRSFKDRSFCIVDLDRKSEIVLIVRLHERHREIDDTYYLSSQWGFVLKDSLAKKELRKLIECFRGYIDGIIEADNVKSYDISFSALTQYMSSKEAMINPAIYFGFRPAVQYTWVKDMRGNTEQLLGECDQNTRRRIRSIANEGRYTVFRPELNEESLDEFYRMHRETYVRTHHERLLIDRDYFEYIWYNLANKDVVSVFFCRDNNTGESIDSIITINFDNTSYYWYGASIDGIDGSVNRYLHWMAMTQCKEDYSLRTGKDDFLYETGAAFPYLISGKEKRISDFKRSFATGLSVRHIGEYVMKDDPQNLNET